MHKDGKSGRIYKNRPQSILFVIACIAANVLMTFEADRTGLPLFLDTAGTILVSLVGGFFPGVITAAATNVACVFFNEDALYFVVVHALIALLASWYVRRFSVKKPAGVAVLAGITALFCGVLSALIQWGLYGQPQNEAVAEMSASFSQATGLGAFAAFLLVNILLNIVDKGLTVTLAAVIFSVMPESFLEKIRDRGWRQRPLSDNEKRDLRKWSRKAGFSIVARSSISLMSVLVISVTIMGVIVIRYYYGDEKEEKTKNAQSAVAFAATVVDGNRMDDYISSGWEVPDYEKTRQMLQKIRDNSPGVEYLYVIKVREDGCHVAFDLDTQDVPAYEPGDVIEIEKAFEPYMPTLLEGGEIEPIESKDKSGWVVTVYHSVKNSRDQTVGYVGADVSLDYLREQMSDFVFRAVLILAGFFILILSYQTTITAMFTLYPVGSMALCVEDLAEAGDDQKKLDENVKKIRKLDIRTGDEIERLYREICDMALNQAEQVRSIRYFADTTAKMQDGLIITMANMVENRDSDTGAHIQKTAAYVKVIVDGLEKKGYYPQKVTKKFKSDVVRSAPLHDVGKINIPDEVLNKPGKLTDEEYEIMKTHTTAGKKILENAISTTSGENYLKEARNMAAYHHERWDGKGYPEGLYGEVIPLSARIMAVADVFDALTSPRVYKPAFPLEKALSILTEGSGTQFDPKCVEVFMENLPEVKVILKKYNEQ